MGIHVEPGKELLAVMMGYESVNFDNSKGETCLEGGKKEARGGEWRVCSNSQSAYRIQPYTGRQT